MIPRASAIVAIGLGAFAVAGGGAASPEAAGGHCPGVDLGSIAFVRGSSLATVDFRRCITRVLVPKGVTGPVQYSADGRFIAFTGGFVPARGGAVTRVPGAGVWSPRTDLLAVETARGGVEIVGPNAKARTLLSDGFGATTLAFSPDGRTLAVSRSLYHGPSLPPPWHQEIWLVNVATGARRPIFRLEPKRALAPPLLAGYSPDGRWLLFWEEVQNSPSLAADGLPLYAVRSTGGRPVLVAGELHYRDFMTWCGGRLVYVIDHGGRLVTQADGLAVAAPPVWRPRTLAPAGGTTSWNSVACPTAAAAARGGGGLAIAAGPSSSGNLNQPLGGERRSIWLASASPGTKPARVFQTVPPKGQTDELPMWSGDGRWIVFVRTTPGGPHRGGRLYAIDPFGGNLVGPIAALGDVEAYYGAFGWSARLDWHR